MVAIYDSLSKRCLNVGEEQPQLFSFPEDCSGLIIGSSFSALDPGVIGGGTVYSTSIPNR